MAASSPTSTVLAEPVAGRHADRTPCGLGAPSARLGGDLRGDGTAGRAARRPAIAPEARPRSTYENRCSAHGPCSAQRRRVLRRHVALVLVEAVLREPLVQVHHDPVPGDLGEHAGRRHAGRHLVALPHREPRHAQPVDAEAVGEHVVGPHRQRRQRPAHRRPGCTRAGRGRRPRPAGIDHHGVRQRPLDHLVVDPLPGRGGEQLRVGQPVDLAAPALRQHRRRRPPAARRRRRGRPRRRRRRAGTRAAAAPAPGRRGRPRGARRAGRGQHHVHPQTGAAAPSRSGG